MNEADRIARDRLRAEREEIAAKDARQALRAATDAAIRLDTVRSLSREVLVVRL
jgi:hypothetical protein